MELTLQEEMSTSAVQHPRSFAGYDLSDVELSAIRSELDQYYQAMQKFSTLEPDQILMALSAYSARMGEIRLQLVRRDTRKSTALRCKEVDPFLEACEFQFKIWSRIVTTKTMELEMTRGFA